MNIRRFGTFDPVLDSSAYIDSQCSIIGQVTLGPHSSVWPMAVIRGDVNYIRIGSETNIQDGAILHVTHAGPFTSPTGSPLIIGNQVTVGHGAILHACTIGDRCLIGMNATILDATVVEAETIIAAGSLVPPRKHLEGGYL